MKEKKKIHVCFAKIFKVEMREGDKTYEYTVAGNSEERAVELVKSAYPDATDIEVFDEEKTSVLFEDILENTVKGFPKEDVHKIVDEYLSE